MSDRATSAQVARSAALAAVLDAIGDLDASGPRFRQVARAVGSAIERGALGRDTRLPAERALAAALGVSRGTAVAAYDALVAEGFVERRRGSGTYVLGAGNLGLPPGREGSALVHRLVDRSTGRAVLGPSEGGPGRAAGTGPGVVGGATEVVDLSLSVLGDADALPDVALTTADLRGIAPDTGYAPWGLPGLRRALAAHVTRWGLPTTPGQVVVTTGAQQAIAAAAACWVRPGDVVAVDDPTYPGAVAAFTQAGARLVPMAVDGGGVRPDEVARALAQRPALVYLQSGPHSPTGAALPEARRRAIAELVTAARVPLVEDAALADLSWSAPVAPPVAAHCGEAAVALVGSLDKVLWGGLRVGFVRAPEPVALRFARVKATHDLGSSAVGQALAERLLTSYDAVVEARRATLRRRYEALAGALRRHLPAWDWPEPTGGLSVWARLPGADATAFARVALRHGVAVAAPAALSCTTAHASRVRLSLGPSPDALDEGARRLADAWQAVRKMDDPRT
jgi:DNA-binding transcriptional MocR family regulator